ncbi:enoyl-CoA hydratase/isomerase family protein [Robertmurraya andreesenii]|uniref:2-(1,2-epoxy-1,2-dihydrophenyl)acetyl-CoA isomerase n=1 Tax=Anoxybacillus andreesenii TaxID=1325932 RepID=A0ABT9V8E4_9BACL|nr:enoyl-CoA hydratase-related protein [Robertmurraya andreesenii]MDQ0157188.1 2-(1,2-epoxy-1,2-dihydrophenyl)acetyl-CoA isomerase [Robertmurraya andreesenii]
MNDRILFEQQKEIATIYLNEPNNLNSLSTKLKQQFLKVLNEIETDPDIKVVIIAGKGRAFCAGGDVKGMANMKEYDPVAIKRNMELSSIIIERLRRMPKVIISSIHGYAAGAGFSLALASDLIVAEEGTKLILSFKNVGLIPDLGIHYYLPKIVGEWRAKQWIWNGIKLTVEEALNYGFSIEIVAKGQLNNRAMELAKEISNGPFQALVYSKLLINNFSNTKLEEILAKENEIQTILRATHDHKEGINAFLEKRIPEFSGH